VRSTTKADAASSVGAEGGVELSEYETEAFRAFCGERGEKAEAK
jgi:hypothetical protein